METITYYRHKPEIGIRVFRHVGYDDNGDFLFADLVEDRSWSVRKVDVPTKYIEDKTFDPSKLIKTTCGSRMQEFGPWEQKENLDYWDVERNNDVTCSFCGSCSWEKFLEVIDKTIEHKDSGVIDWGIEKAIGKNYKYYITQPAVGNANDGAIKFYTWHMPKEIFNEERKDELNQINKKLFEAINIHKAKYMKSYSKSI